MTDEIFRLDGNEEPKKKSHSTRKKAAKTSAREVAIFRQSNRITTASQRLDLVERRIIMTAISKIDRRDEPTDQKVYYVDASDLARLGGDSKSAYRDMKSAADTLFNRQR